MQVMSAAPDIVQLYRQYGHGLFAYARSLSGRRETAEDVVQEAFLRLLGSESPLAKSSPSAFLYGVVRNLSLDETRQSAMHHRHEPAVARSLAERVSKGLGDEQAMMQVALAELEELPLDQREVVVLKVFSGMTFEEIGDLLHLPAATAASRYRYALEKLLMRLAPAKESP
jgi:RNA polymerase sigma-70 factor, ECF subfamily